MEFTGVILAGQPQWILLTVALAAGVIGALLAVFAERIAFALGGFFAGAYLGLIAAQSLGAAETNVVLALVAGLTGAALASWIMDWAIIALSCLVGAGAVVQGLDLGERVSSIIFIGLLIAGVFVQSRVMARSRKTSPRI